MKQPGLLVSCVDRFSDALFVSAKFDLHAIGSLPVAGQ
jgi:hypothetical protein